MSDAQGREPPAPQAPILLAGAPVLESVDSAFAAAAEPELPPAEPLGLAAPATPPAPPRASGLSHAVFLLGGVGLALLGGLMLRGNDDAASGLAALRRDAELSAVQAEARVKAAEARFQAGADALAKTTDAQGKALAMLDKRVKEAEIALGNVATGGTAALDAKISGLDGRIAGVESALAAPKTPLQATEVKIEPPAPAAANMAAQLVVAQSLLTALERGTPFNAEVAALQNLGIDPARLAALAPMAASGAPSPAMLAADLKKLAPAMLAATAPEVPKSQNWMDQITNSAASLVTVRRDGDPAGDNVPGVLAIMDSALAKGDMAALDAAWAKFPAKAQGLSKDWLSAAKSRFAAAEAARSLISDAIARLAAKKS